MVQGVDVGDLLDGRYRLVRRCSDDGDKQLWQATDELLERTVAVHLITGRTRVDAKLLTAAAGRAGSVSDARWVRVLDVGLAPAARKVNIWVVSEWVDGQTLTALLRREPLRDRVATHLIAACAHAVAAAEEAGAAHGSLDPDEVLIPADGNPRLTGLEVHEALVPDNVTADPAAHDDIRGLAALLYAAVTGRWPLPGWGGLPPASRGDGRHPKQQRYSVGRAVDEVVARALDGGYPDARSFARALDGLPQAPLVPAVDDGDSPRRDRWRRIAWRVIPPLLVSTIGLTAWTAGRDLGRVPGQDRSSAPIFPQSHTGGGTTLVWHKPPTVTSFDPQGNGDEDPGGVGLALDDDPSTLWTTDTYHGNAHFGGLKSGVGLLIDLGKVKSVDTARLLLSLPGANIELRAGDAVPAQADDLTEVASRLDSPANLTLRLPHLVKARYWLVWITSLPPTEADSYALGIAEIELLR